MNGKNISAETSGIKPSPRHSRGPNTSDTSTIAIRIDQRSISMGGAVKVPLTAPGGGA